MSPAPRPRRPRVSLPLALLLVVGLPAASARGGWGGDLNPEDGPRILAEVQQDLVRLVQAQGSDRDVAIRKFADRSARGAIEAVKRFRNPELKDLFLVLLEHEDWHVQHRALLALEHYWDESTFPRAWALLRHPTARLREKAAITCLKLWDGSTPAEEVAVLLAREEDDNVRACLEALARRAEGRQTVERLHREPVRLLENGLQVVPFLSSWAARASSAPGYEPQVVSRTAKASASRLPPAPRWVAPILGYGEEEIPGAPLEPFGNLDAAGDRFHVGDDIGACLDGAGVYAPADGIVKLVHSGDEHGTVIVLEHHLGEGQLVTSMLFHGGDVVFVTPGERVAARQLLMTVGTSHSLENGGPFAHVHLGLYRGPFDSARTLSDVPVARGLGGWIDPAAFLASWILRTRPLLEVRRTLAEALGRAVEHVAHEDHGRAWVEAQKVLATTGDVTARADAEWLLARLARTPHDAMRRARAWIDAGYPTAALEELESWAGRLKQIPDAPTLEEQLQAWKADERIQHAVDGERKVAAAERKSAKSRDPSRMRKTWEELQDEYGATCLAPRIESHLTD